MLICKSAYLLSVKMKTMIYQNQFLFMFHLIFCCFAAVRSQNASATSSTIRCLPHQSSALLQLKQEFSFNQNPFTGYDFYPYNETGYPKMKFWKAGKDCCDWEGVTCTKTGQVVGLDLSDGWLQGPLHPNSSLFGLCQLQQLNLAFNNFSFSRIPSRFGQLSKLTHLNLSYSFLYGDVPSEIAWLTNLISLDLSAFYFSPLYLRVPTLFQNVTNLRELRLDQVNLSSLQPQSLANLSSLVILSLWSCSLVGEFPKNIFQLPKIQVIDLPYNDELTGILPEFYSSSKLKSLILELTSFSGELPDSIGNLISLNDLDLFFSNFSGTIPPSIGNLSQLTDLSLSSNNFNGQLPSTLGNLSQLTELSLEDNNFNGQLPSTLGNLSQLTDLSFSGNNFNGQLPSTLGNLAKLTNLYFSWTGFSGEVPSSFGNLVQLESLYMDTNRFHVEDLYFLKNLSRLKELSIRNNSFYGQFPLWMTNLTQLQYLEMSDNSFNGSLPSSLFRMPSLKQLHLDNNNFTGTLPLQNISSSQLAYLSLSGNKLSEKFPRSISKLKNLTSLALGSNNFSGTIEMDFFSKLSSLSSLYLSHNNLSVIYQKKNSTLPNFTHLYLSSCNIGPKFPNFLRTQNELLRLDLSNNKIEGKIPQWFFSTSIETLQDLNLSHNSLSSWEQAPFILQWRSLEYLDIRSNALQGSLVVPPISIEVFSVSKNQLSGRISSLFCKLSNLVVLDISNNHLNGTIPQCLSNSSRSLLVLDMKRNNFHGTIPQTFLEGSQLETLDLSQNRLQGKIPPSLINCGALEVLNLGNNQISDTFPFWLQNLPNLKVLVLRSNKLYGPIWHPKKFLGFLKLRMVDLSSNNFSGELSSNYFRNWSAMTKVPLLSKSESKYVGDDLDYYLARVNFIDKALEIVLVKILTIYTSIDLSNNNFHGEIPSSIGDLRSLDVLNLSKNQFSGKIHLSFCNLSNLEFLVVSNNQLSGTIPQCLGSSCSSLLVLDMKRNNFHGKIPQTFLKGSQLETLDLSHNRLQGRIPPSLIKCKALEVLNLGDNLISGTFPFWLQNLPNLQVLVLRSNKFYGQIWHPRRFLGFVKLHIVDLSFNNFSGELPVDYFRNWSAMTKVPLLSKSKSKYMGDNLNYYHASMTLMIKGLQMELVKILTILISIDLSNNNFHGEIPSFIGELQSLVVLNLSSNNFEGHIPSSFGNLLQLESLDLSKNKLFGRIPPQLGGLTFLAYLNLSENQLVGPIPQDRQFSTFPNSSFEGNDGLCDFPLPKKCENIETPAPYHNQESESKYGFGWKVVVMGYGCGFIIGGIIGHVVILRWPCYFEKIFGARLRW